MARSRTGKRKNRELNSLQEKGFAVCALGVVMLLMPFFVGKSPATAAMTAGLRPIGWLAIAAGIALLGLHKFLKNKQSALASTEPATTVAPAVRNRRTFQHGTKPATPEVGKQAPVNPAVRERSSRWSSAVFSDIEWRRFEAVCEKLFAQAGFETKSQSHGADGGVDIWLHSRNAEGPVAVVQCKHWRGKAVGVKEIREFFGVMSSHQLKRGTYATTSTYTEDAQQFAKTNGINALDGNGLLALIAKRTPEQQQELLDVAYEGEYWRPTCASCGIKMIECASSKGRGNFWGCSNYPKCRSRLPMAATVR